MNPALDQEGLLCSAGALYLPSDLERWLDRAAELMIALREAQEGAGLSGR